MAFTSPRIETAGSSGVVGHRVKECCVQLHSCVQKWKELSSRGYDLADKLINSSIQLKYTQHNSSKLVDAELWSRIENKVMTYRETLFPQLNEVKDQLLKVVDKMGALVGNLRSAVELCLNKDQDPSQPLFSTMPPAMFRSYSEELYLAYSEEMSLKEKILTDLVSQEDRDTLTGHLICWIHQPYITDTITAHLDAMLIECGLRS